MPYTIISYCNGRWPDIGGVARYDTQLKLIFPERVFFKGPQQKEEMLKHDALLCTGFHRHEGHYGENKQTMHVAVVEFLIVFF